MEGGTTHEAVMIIRLMVLLLATICLTNGIRQGCFVWPESRVGGPVVNYLALALISTLTSPYTNQSLQWLIVFLIYAALLYFVVFFVTRWNDVLKLLVVVTAVGIIEAAGALVQGGLYGMIRPTGTFFNPNFLAGYLAAVGTVLVSVLCYARIGMFWARRTTIVRGRLRSMSALKPSWRMGRARLAVVLGVVPALSLLLGAIIWTGSRGGVLALVVGVSLVLGVRFGRRGLFAILVILMVGLVIPNPFRTRVIAEHTVNPVGYARLQMWKQATLAMIDHPFGVGLGLYQYVYPRYAFPVDGQIIRYERTAQTPHSEYVQMGVELGVVSVVVFCWGIIGVGQAAASAMRLRLRRWQRGTIVGVTGATAGILVHAAVDSNLHEPAIAILLILFVAIIILAERLSKGRDERARIITAKPRLVWALSGFAVISMLAVAIVRLGLAWIAYEEGVRAHDAKDLQYAADRYRLAITLDPGKALYHNALASVYFRIFQTTGEEGAAEAAMAELRSAIERNPIDGRLFSLLGFVHASFASSRLASQSPALKLSWLQSAVWAYERALELEPYSALNRLELGKLYLALGDRRTAEQRVLEAIELEPNFLPGREWLVTFYLESGNQRDLVSARRQYQEILDRQQRYSGWLKDQLEERYLRVDVATLASKLERVKG